jgi:preprotein translocase subunit SecA
MAENVIVELIARLLSKIFGTRNERILAGFQPVVEQVNSLEEGLEKLSDEALRAKTDEFRKRLSDGEVLDELLPEAFAVVREASKRTTGMRHFDVQLMGGIVLHQGTIAEMATGEGKTLVATLAAYLNALERKGVHIVTVNDYLARRDREWMGPIYELLGMTVGVIQADMDNQARQEAYACDITYGTNNEFGFDYLRDNMKLSVEEQVQIARGLNYAIVDEVDSILIDEARTPLIISGPAFETPNKYYEANRVVESLRRDRDYEVKEKEHTVVMSEEGMARMHQLLGIKSIYGEDEETGDILSGDKTTEQMDWEHFITQGLRAKELFQRDKDYIVTDDKEVVIVDEFTGRLMPGRTWSDGLHQAIEAKERLRIRDENQTLATITFQNFFKLYNKIAGMTGTAATEAVEFDKIYELDVVVVPTNKPLIRYEYSDIVFLTEKEKFTAVADEIAETHKEGRPLLVGTLSIEKSERLSSMLKRRGIDHEVLNAKHHAREAEIVAKAGQMNHVTIATNMAGRGTDIVLGEGVAALQGLHVIGTERHDARRIDNQLRGRAGRQGDPGSSRFYVSLEDDLMRIFASDRVKSILERVGMEEGQQIESRMVTRAIEKAQKRVEEHNFAIRKNLLEYDEVMNKQRTIIYGQRQQILRGEGLKEFIQKMIEDRAVYAVDTYLDKNLNRDQWDYRGLSDWARKKFGIEIVPDELSGKEPGDVEEFLYGKAVERLDYREKTIGADEMRQIEKYVLLQAIDTKWKDHLWAMDHLKSGIGLRSFAQKDPKIEYIKTGEQYFYEMMDAIREEVTNYIFKVRLGKSAEEEMSGLWNIKSLVHSDFKSFERQKEAAMAASHQSDEVREPFVRKSRKVGRNEPCPCGSGKKYKYCCGGK